MNTSIVVDWVNDKEEAMIRESEAPTVQGIFAKAVESCDSASVQVTSITIQSGTSVNVNKSTENWHPNTRVFICSVVES